MNKINHSNIVAHLDHILTEFTQKEAIPGLAVGIVQDSQMLYTKGFGVKSILTQEPVDERTLFHQASISKTLVATAIMQLVEREMIQLDCSICGATISDVFPYHRAHGPSSTLYANAVDMCRYAIAQLNKGITADGETIVQSQSFDELWKPNAPTGEGAGSSDVGLSWFLGQYKGHKIVSHSGMDTGFQSILKILPELGIAVSVMINSDYVWPASVCNALVDLLLGDHVPHIQRSLAHHLATMTINHSIELAWDEYQRIQMSNESELYYNWESEFDFIANTLTDNGYQQEAMKLLELTAQLHHRSSI